MDTNRAFEQCEPLTFRLPSEFSLRDAFARLCHLPGCLWLDSAGLGPQDEDAEVGRFSFLTADPIRRLIAHVRDSSPWATLSNWCQELPAENDPDLPPFQGGLAGLIGYEAATWLEPVGLARINDLPTPAVSMGLYDWTVAVDHFENRAWLICRETAKSTHNTHQPTAQQRAEQILAMLNGNPPERKLFVQSMDSKLPGEQIQTVHDGLTSNFSGTQFRGRVAEIVRRIRDGDSFQVNLAQRLLCKATTDSRDLYLRLREENPAPFAAYYDGGAFQVLSSSPEGFLQVRDRVVQTRPIKGTVPRSEDAEENAQFAAQLLSSEKDRAENIMIVDLLRNDLSRVCADESVVVKKLCEIEAYQYVQHLVSVVEGKLRDERSIVDLLMACFPGGSITGAPKVEAMRTIAELEPHQRGPYCGSLGYISSAGVADFNILIRTVTAADGFWQIPVGGGITAKSDPVAEEAETWNKAEGMLRALDL